MPTFLIAKFICFINYHLDPALPADCVYACRCKTCLPSLHDLLIHKVQVVNFCFFHKGKLVAFLVWLLLHFEYQTRWFICSSIGQNLRKTTSNQRLLSSEFEIRIHIFHFRFSLSNTSVHLLLQQHILEMILNGLQCQR